MNSFRIQLAGMIAAIMLIGVALYAVYDFGRKAVLAEIEKANRIAIEKADEAGQRAMNCPPERWNRKEQTCAPSP